MIFTGSISFVGSKFVDINYKNPNMMIKPGITGLPHLKSENIQTNAIRDFEQYYVMHYSFISDIEIIIKSILRF